VSTAVEFLDAVHVVKWRNRRICASSKTCQ